jgi:hypothetical protein
MTCPSVFQEEPRPLERASQSLRSSLLLFALLNLSIFFSGGCVVYPVPVSSRTKAPSGEERKVDLQFIHAGTTTHDEVTKNLAWIDTGCNQPRLFWGRWYGSSMWIMGMGANGGGGAGRLWGDHNLLVEFDEKGIVQRSEIVSDKKLNAELRSSLKNIGGPPLDLSVPEVIQARSVDSYGKLLSRWSISLTGDGIQLTAPHQYLTISPRSIKRVDAGEALGANADIAGQTPPDLAFLVVTFHFSEKTSIGKSLTVEVDPPGYLTIYRFLVQNSSAM